MADKYINTCSDCAKEFITVQCPSLGGRCRPCAATRWWSTNPKKKLPLTCKTCGKQFPFDQSGGHARIHCSRKCRLRQSIKKCEVCGKTFSVPDSNATRYIRCSKKCSATRGKDALCLRCNKTFRYSAANGRRRSYCSENCRRPPIILQCETCGKDFRPTPSDAHNRRFCSFGCYRRFAGETSIERTTRELIEATGLAVMREHNIGQRDVFDFFVPARNLLIECDGAYWHSKHCTKKRDKAKQARAIAAGYNFVRFSESLIESKSFPDHLSRALSGQLTLI